MTIEAFAIWWIACGALEVLMRLRESWKLAGGGQAPGIDVVEVRHRIVLALASGPLTYVSRVYTHVIKERAKRCRGGRGR
jgi:hypothetical protein